MGKRERIDAMATPDLDAWLPDPDIRTRHARTAAASEVDLWEAARSVKLRDTKRLGRLVTWRIPGVPQDSTYWDMFATDPFATLEETEHCVLSGMCGRIWTLRRDYPHLGGAQDFRAWEEGGTARVLFGHWVEPSASGGSTLVSEARVKAVDRIAGLRLKSLWLVVGPFERLIGAEPLELAAERAETA